MRTRVARVRDLMAKQTTLTAEDFDAGDNPFFAASVGNRVATAWMTEALGKGPTPRVQAFPGEARKVDWLGWLVQRSIANPAWGAGDPAGLAMYTDAMRAAYASAIDQAKAIRWNGSAVMAALIEPIPANCLDLLSVGEEEATTAVDTYAEGPPPPALMELLVDRIRPSTLRKLAESYPTEPWSMRAFARMAKMG
jgi:hypothetical protein